METTVFMFKTLIKPFVKLSTKPKLHQLIKHSNRPNFTPLTFKFMSTEKLNAPVAEKRDFAHTYHGQKYPDPYHWLRDDTREKPDVLGHLKLENKYADQFFEPLKPLADTIYNEMVSRIAEDDVSVPVLKGSYEYYTRTLKGKQYGQTCRKLLETGEEEILLDLNEFKDEHLDLGTFKVTKDHLVVGYTLDVKGDEKYDIFFKNLKTGETKLEVKESTSYFAFSTCGKYIYYLAMDDILRAYRLYRHKLGDSQDKDKLLFQEDDLKFGLDLSKSTSEKYLFMEAYKSTSSEVHFIDLDQPESELTLFSPRAEDRLYSIEHQNDDFLITTNRFNNEKYINFYALKTKIDDKIGYQDESSWTEIVPYHLENFIIGIYGLKGYILLEERFGGLAQIRVIETSKNGLNNQPEGYRIDLPEPIFVTGVQGLHLDYDKAELPFSYSSLTTPSTFYRYNLVDKTRKLIKQEPVLGEFDKNLYQSERVFAGDVPISLVYRKDLFKRDGTNPLHLYAYGSYGYSMEPSFRSKIVSLLDRGFVYAIAHIRGGTELGRHWYELEGKLLHKQNTFRDFAQAAKELISSNYTSPHILSIEGGSAGGLLMGAVLNQNPELFNAVIADVPFVDVMNTMMDPTIPLTVNEYEEWGDPNNKQYFDYMMKYSPYDNVPNSPKHFPHVLVRSGLNDPRVQYWEPAKHVAKLREMLSQNPVKPISSEPKEHESRQPSQLAQIINMGAGHFGASGRYDMLKEASVDYAFLIASAQRLTPLN